MSNFILSKAHGKHPLFDFLPDIDQVNDDEIHVIRSFTDDIGRRFIVVWQRDWSSVYSFLSRDFPYKQSQ